MANNKNGILKKMVDKIGETASRVGSSMIDYATGGDYLGLNNDLNEKISTPTGLERKPSQLELNLGLAKEQPTINDKLKGGADYWGTRLYQWGQSKSPRNQQMNEFYKNNTSLTDQGKKYLDETNTVYNKDVLDYTKNVPDGSGWNSWGLNWGSNPDSIFKTKASETRKNINISPAAWDKREVLVHELTHYIDSKEAISAQKNFLSDVNNAMKKNPALGNYIERRTLDYRLPEGATIDPTEIYSMVGEFLGNLKSGTANGTGPVGFPKQLVKYFPHVEIPKGLLTN